MTTTSQPEKTFKELYSLQMRKQEATRMSQKYPERMAIILEKGNKEAPELDKYKYLVPKEITIGQFLFIVRKRANRVLKPDQALYLFVNNTLPATSAIMSSLIKERDEDGFLYITYSTESTFG